ncbi:MAG: bifunctional DNA-binding transcriptional regulator/O6-methylguanine-DNA methyltransferase Ada [Pseudomonadota bacterium]
MKPSSSPLSSPAPATADPLALATVNDPRWVAVTARDAQADGTFVYAVRTTGVYCRPSCASRQARPENVSFHATSELARQAGFRACRRCHPDRASPAAQQAELVAGLCRFIQRCEQPPRLSALAAQAQLSTYHLHRVFKAVTGLTPQAYARAHRAQRLREALAHSGTVTEAVFEAGYNASGPFYTEAQQVLGMTPGRYRAGGAGVPIRFAVGQCSLGAILVACTERGVCAILLGDDPQALTQDLQDRFPQAELRGAEADFEQWVAQVVGLVEAPHVGLDLPLDVRGTAFQQRVWQALRDIPPGQTASYTEVACRMGAPTSARAVAQACGANALAVAIPCHRVVRGDGSLSGYRWGVERKRTLLNREAQVVAALPKKSTC